MSRLIDADALISVVNGDAFVADGVKDYVRYYVGVMPTIEPQRKKGKWIVHPGGKFVGFPYVHYECDQCRDFEPEERNFCPNCGADMREDGEKA